MNSFDDIFSALGGLDAAAYKQGQERSSRLAAGIPASAFGPWDGALAVARQAKEVSRLYKRLAELDAS